MIFSQVTRILTVVAIHQVTSHQATPLDDPDVGLNTAQMIENNGYPCQNHRITTEDGYILTYHRIPHGRRNNTSVNKDPVLLMHSLATSGADFISMGPDRSLGYILADQGYDVWLGNSRGNAWCKNHTKIDPITDAKLFFTFSWHEVGYYDLPAAIDYILNVTNRENLFYIGHSMGGSAFLVLTSTRPEYNSKIRLASLMAPAAFLGNNSNPMILGLLSIFPQLEALTDVFEVYEIPFVDLLREIGVKFCWIPEIFPLCQAFIFAFVGADPEQLDREKIDVYLTNTPSNSPLKQWSHYAQLIRDGGFSQYDYGRTENLKIYRSEKPPAYDLSKISAPVAIYYAKNDALVHTKDMENLRNQLPNVIHYYLVSHDLFNHLDFVIAKDAPKLLYPNLLKIMRRF